MSTYNNTCSICCYLDSNIREQVKAKSECIVSSMRSLIHQERMRRVVDFAWLVQYSLQCFDTVGWVKKLHQSFSSGSEG